MKVQKSKMNFGNNFTNKPVDKEVEKKKKDAEKEAEKLAQEELTEEDKALKEELELYVRRLEESNTSLYKPALEALRTHIKSSTTSMTSVPKPLKFLRPHYENLKTLFETNMNTEETKNLLADIISILAMTIDTDSHKTNGDALKYRLIGGKLDAISSWGHEYVRHISGEIASDFQSTVEHTAEYKEKLLNLVEEIIPYNMRHNAEAEACDLLIEIERLDLLSKYIDTEDLCQKVCLYLRSVVPFVPDPDNIIILKIILLIFLKFNKLTDAIRVAMQLQDNELIEDIFNKATDASTQKQIAFMIGRQQVVLDIANADLLDICSNSHLNTHFLTLARELDIMEPKTLDDIYKSHLEPSNRLYSTSVDSARYNLASSFVNGFVNAAFGKDKILLNDDGNKWLYKNKDLGMFSATGSLGLILLWDVDGGLAQIDKYLYSKEDNIKAGALLACGIVNSGVRNDCDPALALLQEYVSNSSNTIRIGAILGLGLAYAGSNRSDLISLLTPVLFEKASMEVIGVTALSCGLIAVGSANSEVTSNIIQILIEKQDIDVKDYFARFLPFALGLCILGKQNSSEAIIEALEVIQNQQFKTMAKTIVEVCAYAATGNVLKIQSLLHICSNNKNDDSSEEQTSSTESSNTSSNTSSTSSTSSKSSSSKKSSMSKSSESNNSSSEFNIQQAIATIGIGLIAMAEDISCEMAFRTFGHLLRYGDSMIKRAVPLALALTSISNPKLNLLETLSKFSHDSDSEVACNAIFAMGLIGAGTNNARLASMLRQLAQYHAKEPNCIFMVRLAQGLTHLGKGTLTLSPFHSDRQLLLPTALAGLLVVLMSLIDPKYTILKAHYLIYFLVPAIQPRMLITFDEQLNPLPVPVRVGQAVDVVGQAGKPKTITGFQTHTTPVLLSIGERAELATEEYIPLTPILEGFVILRKNPNYTA